MPAKAKKPAKKSIKVAGTPRPKKGAIKKPAKRKSTTKPEQSEEIKVALPSGMPKKKKRRV